MFELFQIVWDLFMVRREVRSGRLNLRKSLIAIGLTVLGYAMLVPAVALYDKHPEYKPLFILALVLTAADFAFLIGLGFYWWRKFQAQQQH
jgi:peptidoglycan/LPS O-acetylase OafA/YrhL